MDSNSPKATEAELARMMEQYGARLAAVCALMLGDRDLAARHLFRKHSSELTKDWSAFAVNVRRASGHG